VELFTHKYLVSTAWSIFAITLNIIGIAK